MVLIFVLAAIWFQINDRTRCEHIDWGAEPKRRQWRMKRGGSVVSKRVLQAAAKQDEYYEPDRASEAQRDLVRVQLSPLLKSGRNSKSTPAGFFCVPLKGTQFSLVRGTHRVRTFPTEGYAKGYAVLAKVRTLTDEPFTSTTGG